MNACVWKNPSDITIPEWLEMTEEEQRIVAQHARDFVQDNYGTVWLRGCIIFCGEGLLHAHGPTVRLEDVPDVARIADSGKSQNRVPFEFFGPDTPEEFVRQRWQALNAALALKAAKPEEPAEE